MSIGLSFLSIHVSAQGPGGHQDGRHQSWPDSLDIITLSGTVIVDSTFFHRQYFLDVDEDGSADYRLMFGPSWYKSEASATLPEDGDSVNVVGQENSRMMGQHMLTSIIVFEINGEKWRDPIQIGGHYGRG